MYCPLFYNGRCDYPLSRLIVLKSSNFVRYDYKLAESECSIMFKQFASRIKVQSDNGKKTPTIITKHMAELARIDSILNHNPSSEFAVSRKSVLVGYLEDEISALESKQVKNTKSVKVGENWLSDDQLARKANRHAGLIQELSRQREEMKRRITEIESALSKVDDSIPMAQREEYAALVNLFGNSVVTLESE